MPSSTKLGLVIMCCGMHDNDRRLSDTSALCLKLAGLLSWPCISTAAALQPTIAMPHLAAASTGGSTSAAASQLMLAALQVGCVAALLGLLLAAGAAAARFAADAGRRRAGADAVAAFGVQVGTLNAAACGLIITQIAIVAARGQAAPPPVPSTNLDVPHQKGGGG